MNAVSKALRQKILRLVNKGPVVSRRTDAELKAAGVKIVQAGKGFLLPVGPPPPAETPEPEPPPADKPEPAYLSAPLDAEEAELVEWVMQRYPGLNRARLIKDMRLAGM
jgi:hypothetical protein